MALVWYNTNMNRPIVVLFAAVVGAASVWGGGFVVAERGRTDNPPVVLPADAMPSFRYAAEELRDHVKGMTGVTLSIVDSGCRGVFLEKGGADLGDEGFRIRTDADGVHITGGCRGVLYGVYELLEEYGGCGWYASWHAVMPRQDAFTIPDNLDYVRRPTFLLREPSWRDVRRNVDFAVRLRMNGAGSNPQEKHGGAAYRFVKGLSRSHTFDRILPAAKYFNDHPEWYSEIGGVRRGGGKHTQICLTNQEAFEEAVKNVLAMIAADPHGARVVGISQNDNRAYCRCAKCAAIDAEEGSQAGTLMRYVNAMSERLSKTYPDIMVETLIYMHTRKPPKLTRPAKNVMPCFCTYEAEFAHPLWESPYIENRNMVPDLEAWGRITDNLFVWDYTTNWRNFLQPMATVCTLQPNFRYYRDNGAKYLYGEGGFFHADFAELRGWLIAKLSWDPDADQERLLKRFFNGYYGAAAPHAEACFRRMHELYRAKPKKVQTIWHRDQPEVLDEDYLDWAISEWTKAEEKVKDDPVLLYNVRTSSLSTLATRLNRTAASVKYVWATRDPAAFAEPRDVKALYDKTLAIIADANAKGHTVQIGDGDGNKTQRTLASWKRIFNFHRPERSSGRAGVDEISCISAIAKLVEDSTSLNGRAYEISPNSQGTPLMLVAGNVALDKGVEYRLRVHARADGLPGAKGEALRVRVFHNTSGERPIEYAKNLEDMSEGWAWYDAGTFLPEANHEIMICGGRFDHGGGANTVKALYVDALEFAPVFSPAKVSERFGFDPEDSTASLQAALDSGLPEIVIDRRESPWVTRPLFVRSNQRIVFEQGAEILAKRGEFKDPRSRLFALIGVTNVTFVGNGAKVKMWANDYANAKKYTRSEHRHAIGAYGCADVTIEGLSLVESGGDGIYLGSGKPDKVPNRNIVIRNCICDGNRRQGLSVISAENLLVEGCVFRNTHGTAPKDGIDFEPNHPSERFLNCVVRNCTFENNAGYSLEFAFQHFTSATKPVDIIIENCRAVGDLGAVKLRTRVPTSSREYPQGRVLLRDCVFSRCVSAPVWTIQNPEGAISLEFERCTFDTFAEDRPDLPLIMQEAPFPDDPVPAEPKFTEVKVVDAVGHQKRTVDRFGDEPAVVPDFTNAKVVDPHPGEMSAGNSLAIRYHAKFIVYADSPREIMFRFRWAKEGKKGRFGFKSEAGKISESSDGTVRFQPKAKGFHVLEAFYGKDAVIFEGANAPVALDCSGARVFQTRWGRDDIAANFLASGGSIHLPLKAGDSADLRFAGCCPDQAVAVSIMDPAGTKVFSDEMVVFWKNFKVEAKTDGLWKVTFAEPTNGKLWDFRFGIRGVPSLVFLTPDRYW